MNCSKVFRSDSNCILYGGAGDPAPFLLRAPVASRAVLKGKHVQEDSPAVRHGAGVHRAVGGVVPRLVAGRDQLLCGHLQTL